MENTLPKSRNAYLISCPVGCDKPLEPTSILLPEGPLLRCVLCGHLISQCDKEQYFRSMAEFDVPQGTTPLPDSSARYWKRSERLLKKVEGILKKRSKFIKLLDVGCSSGAFLNIAGQLEFQAEGVEPAPQAARTAQMAGLTVHLGVIEDMDFPESSFDVVTIFEVVEHLKDPLSLFRECHRIIRPEGLLVVGTGNTASWSATTMRARWEYLHLDKHGGHVSFFNPLSMSYLAKRSGFVIEKLETRSVRFFENGDCSLLLYRLAKIAAELLNLPSRLLGRGHDMLVFMRR